MNKNRKPIPIVKPYKVPLNIDNKPLPYKSLTTDCKILLTDKPLYSGEIRSQLNPFSIRLCGGSEFAVMQLARKEWPNGQVLEINERTEGKPS